MPKTARFLSLCVAPAVPAAKAVLAVMAVLAAAACGDAEKQRIYVPEPIVDADPYSELARAVRAHNSVATGRATIEGTDQAILDSIHEVREEPGLPADATWRLDLLEQQVQSDPEGYVDPQQVAWIAALGHREKRDTFYVLYGWLTQMEVDREVPFVQALAAALSLKGYRLTVDTAVTPEIFHAYLSRRDAVGLLWRSEGWFSRRPEDPHERIVARVWTTLFDGHAKHMIFADDWTNVLSEGLCFVAIASCGTAGPYMEDEVNILDDLGEPSELVFHTFHTELHDRTVFLRTYRSLLATSGYQFDSLSWTAATEMLPDRSDLEPGLAETGRQEILRIVGQDRSSHLVMPTLERDPVTWIPLIIEEYDTATQPGQKDNFFSALNWLSGVFTGTPEGFDTAQGWRDWWDSPAVVTLREDTRYARDHAPAEADLWMELASEFTSLTNTYQGMPRQGIHMEEFCWERWFRCLYGGLGPWTRDTVDPIQLFRTAPANDPDMCAGPLPAVFTVTYDPSADTLAHNLGDVVAAVTPEHLTAHCATTDN
jgi:hypothetical protein